MPATAHRPVTYQQVQLLVKRFQLFFLLAVLAMLYGPTFLLRREYFVEALICSTLITLLLGLAIYQITEKLLGKRRAKIRFWGFILPTVFLPPLILIIPLVYLADYKRAQYVLERPLTRTDDKEIQRLHG